MRRIDLNEFVRGSDAAAPHAAAEDAIVVDDSGSVLAVFGTSRTPAFQSLLPQLHWEELEQIDVELAPSMEWFE